MHDLKIPQIERVEVDWSEGFANHPSLIVHVDDAWDFPSPYKFWPHRLLNDDTETRLYLATNGPWAHFVADATKPGQTHTLQFDGQSTGELLLEDGSYLRVYSGWSSAADAVNRYLDPADHLVGTTLKDSGKVTIGRGGVDARKDAIEPLLPEGIYFVETSLGRGPYIVPSCEPDRVIKPSGQICERLR